MVVRVLRVRVDVAFARQLEARGLGEADDRRALHIAALFLERRIHRLGQVMVDDAEGAAGFQHRIDLLERLDGVRSEEHTSELQSLMRISYAVFCLKKKKRQIR